MYYSHFLQKFDVIHECFLTLCVMCVQSAYWLATTASDLRRPLYELQQQVLLQLSEYCEIRSGQSSDVPLDSEFICLLRIETLESILFSASVDQMQTFGMIKVKTIILYIVPYS